MIFGWITTRLAAIGAVLLAALAALGVARRDGKKAAAADARNEDWEHAQDIRDRVDAVPPARLRDDDPRGYRD